MAKMKKSKNLIGKTVYAKFKKKISKDGFFGTDKVVEVIEKVEVMAVNEGIGRDFYGETYEYQTFLVKTTETFLGGMPVEVSGNNIYLIGEK